MMMSMITLFPDQVSVIEEVRAAFRSGARAPLLVAPCGWGKTVAFSFIACGAQRLGHNVLILAHRIELIDQISAALSAFGVRHGIIAAGYDYRRGHSVYVGSVFTVVRRLSEFTPRLIIVDEAHHAISATTWGKILNAYPAAKRLGVTATPQRASGEGLGDLFDRLVVGPSTATMVAAGRLSPLRTFAPPGINLDGVRTRMGEFVVSDLLTAADKPTITGSAVEHYRKHADGKQAAVFCVSVEHAKHVAQQFRDAWYPSESVDGKLDRDVRRRIVGAFSRGEIKVITSCDLISEGFDCPRIEVGISLRPTQSLGLWLQQCGRILRAFPDKSSALLLDHAGNTLRHGLPTDERIWTLAGDKSGAKREKPHGSIRICTACFAAQESGKTHCRNCGHAFPGKPREVGSRDGELQELTPEMLAARRERQTQGRADTLDALIALGRARGYSHPERWAAHVFQARELKRRRA